MCDVCVCRVCFVNVYVYVCVCVCMCVCGVCVCVRQFRASPSRITNDNKTKT